MSTPGYTEKIKAERLHDLWLDDRLYERIFCIKCEQEMGYIHDGGAGEYSIETICHKCAKTIHYEKMGMFE